MPNKNTKKETMLVVRSGLLIYLIFSAFSCRLGENDTIIKGKVIDSSNSPIENVTVLLKKKDWFSFYNKITNTNNFKLSWDVRFFKRQCLLITINNVFIATIH